MTDHRQQIVHRKEFDDQRSVEMEQDIERNTQLNSIWDISTVFVSLELDAERTVTRLPIVHDA